MLRLVLTAICKPRLVIHVCIMYGERDVALYKGLSPILQETR